ncbi:Quinidine resistance protein 1 [Sphaceloma murrayae]|uniref:Quinidine resistance protein 1 n=1 Tax=Sphaceloma murrayae TaxID=2082308 RepID=A0A2K1QP72_9PEZI|nr:Quinidine resistance protein 1 [Sphaceloma murrayae]
MPHPLHTPTSRCSMESVAILSIGKRLPPPPKDLLQAAAPLKLRDSHDPWTLPSIREAVPGRPCPCCNRMVRKPKKSFSIFWQPRWTIWDPESPPKFSLWIVFLYAWVCTTSVAVLYYNQPILGQLAAEFDIDQAAVSRIPTLMQAGSATGIALICPTGDILKRRKLVLVLLCITACSWTGLCLATSLPLFLALSFIVALTALATQILLPLVGDICPPEKRAFCLSIAASGITMGIIMGRVVAGIMATHFPWRSVYWFGLGTQLLSIVLLYLFMPDYPVTNTNLPYPRALLTVLTIPLKHPAVAQMCLVLMCIASTHANFWMNLTFLLSGSPYHFSTFLIGLFGLFSLVGVLFNPAATSLASGRAHSLVCVVVGVLMACAGIAAGTFLGTRSIAGPVLQAIVHDTGFTFLQVTTRDVAYGVDAKARNRINTALTICIFAGNLTGTALGGAVYPRQGWMVNGTVLLVLALCGLVFGLLRGPWERRWVGWRGGWGWERKGASSGTKLSRLEKGKGRVQADKDKDKDRRGGLVMGQRIVEREGVVAMVPGPSRSAGKVRERADRKGGGF